MLTTIGRGLIVKGTIHADEPLTIAGDVHGDVIAPNQPVAVLEGGRVEGAITARRLAVHGRASGRVIAIEVVRLHDTAFVRADIASPKIAIEDGAHFTGSVEPARVDAALRVQAYRASRADQPATTAAG